MEKIKLKLTVSLLAAVFLFACSEKNLRLDEDMNLNSYQEFSATYEEEAFVSLKQATSVAEAFLSNDVKSGAKSFASASVETVRDKSNNPLMYIINYPEGGWVIVSATRNYYPVLAYNDEGAFEIKLESEMGGVVVWLDETKEVVRISPTFDDSTKIRMRGLWSNYETNDFKIPKNSTAKSNYPWVIMEERMSELYLLYGSSGWKSYYSLLNAQGVLRVFSVWSDLINLSNNLGSPPEYTIVAIKDNTTTTGTLLATQWHQSAPFNSDIPLVGGDITGAGCGPVAMAQIMKYHQKPASNFTPPNIYPISYYLSAFNWSNVFNWSNMPNTGSQTNSSHSTHYLIHAAGRAADVVYYALPLGGGTVITGVQHAFKNIFGYTDAQIADHNISTVRTNIITHNRPVYMTGEDSNSNKHAWVCDGVQDYNISYFVEFFNGSGYYNPGYYPYNYPGYVNVSYYHMNWCLGNYYLAGWYINNNPNPHGGSQNSFINNRKNLYITK